MLIYIFIIAGFCFVIEKIFPGWSMPKVKTWHMRVVLVNFVQLAIVLIAGVTWEIWFSAYSLFNTTYFLGNIGGGIFAYFIATFIFYWWHRWRHTIDLLWLGFHQIHHSPQRIEVITSFYKHPFEMITNSIIGSILIYTILGLTMEGGAVYTFCTAIGEFFYHTNIKTPQWIGYFFQRPEMHRIHHQHNRHKNNYGDIVWWDMIFGTYENPKTFDYTCGFDPEKEERLIDMILYKDVHKS
ncbi:sterol desaturase family protein [Leptospira jelokensis]|uniref:sterol desaturase family protein n=1 Tax=Leptospira jelokensis TaxID=2484931 RepID=UPI0010911472|nr:sterol desaturase family protein [Leptospira jelokensis]TGM07104.1 sterol desaturase family protein [Leptospira jelokensis]